MNKKRAFTLAEVLIVIGVIGIVAALTIPALIALINDKVDINRKEVIEDRLIQGMNQLNTLDDGFNASQYTDTEGFVRALSKYYKMSQICAATELNKCFPYGTLKYTKKSGEETAKNWTDISTPADFGLMNDEYLVPAGFISAGGTPFVMLLKKDCIMDTGTGLQSIPTSCVQYMYDNNGSNIPNKFGLDLVHSNPLAIGVLPPDGRFNIPMGDYTTYLVLGNIYQSGSGLANGINTCDGSDDKKYDDRGSTNSRCSKNRWAAAKKVCFEAGFDLPNEKQLQEISCRVNGKVKSYSCSGTTKDNRFAAVVSVKASTTDCIWSSRRDSTSGATYVCLSSGYINPNLGVDWDRSVICIGK